MPDATPNDFVAVILGLPPQLQGIVLFGVGLGGAILVWRRFVKSYTGPTPTEPKAELLIGESAAFADMQPIRDLIGQMNLLTMQLMKNEVSNSSLFSGIAETTKRMVEARIAAGVQHEKSQLELMQALRELADLLSQHLVDLRQEREEREDERERKEALEEGRRLGYQQGLSERPSPPVRNNKIKPTSG